MELPSDAGCSPTGGAQLTRRIVATVAADLDCEAGELTPLATVIDPEAVYDVVHGAPTAARVAFEYHDREVVVRSDGSVSLQSRTGER